MKKYTRITAVILVFILLTIPANAAVSGVEVTGYDRGVNYLKLMTECAEEGGKHALNMGKIYETQRNAKIAAEGLNYEPTNFFDGRSGAEIIAAIEEYTAPKPKLTYAGRYYITGYDICYSCCGKTDGITASGTYATAGRTVATGREFSFGTELYIDGIGYRTVEDRGVSNGRVDVVCGSHSECYAITGYYDVYVVNN